MHKFFYSDPLSLTRAFIIYSVTSIGDYAFKNFTSLERITLPKSVTYIGDVNSDGEVNIMDATQIQKYIAELVTKL